MTHVGTDPVKLTPNPDPTDDERLLWDPRGYYRRAMAVVAPLPLLGMGLVYLIQPAPAGADFAETYEAVVANPGSAAIQAPLSWLFFAFLIPAVLAVAAVTWQRVPKLTAIAVSFCVPAFAAAFGLNPPGVGRLALLTDKLGLDPVEIGRLNDGWWEDPVALVGALPFLIGIVFGLGMLGIALWRSGQAPAWMGIALAVAGATHPFLPNNMLQGIGLLIGAAGFAGASVALLRITDGEFAARPGPHNNRPSTTAGTVTRTVTAAPNCECTASDPSAPS